ncbi:MAG TPA: HAD hydrolase-like protein [Micavibrio sp.]|nr:HAD hydrolase-like protein [Micavibrio sp.]
MKHLAVFDWNGTLFDDTPATLQATNIVLSKFGIGPLDLHTLQETFTFPLIHFYERIGVSPDDYLKHAEEEGASYLEAYEACNGNCTIMEGAFDLLDWLGEMNVHSMILSNHLQNHLDADVARLGVGHYMQHVSGNKERATMTQGLSKQIRLEAYMEDRGFAPENTFIIGDSHEEPELARRLGILGISIAGGLLSAARLEKYKADHIVHRLTEVRPILEKHWKL